MSQQYNNSLDSWYQSCPWPVQKVLESPYQQVSGWLRWVTGDPNKVAGQAPTYEAVAREISRISTEVGSVSAEITVWEGQARAAYDAKMVQVRESLNKLAPAVAQTRAILDAAAQTSVEAANMILDIIRSVIEFLLTSLAVSAALAAFTFGAAFGAWIAANLAKGAQALAKIMQGLQKVAQILTKIAEALTKVAEIMRKVKQILATIREVFLALEKAKKGASLAEKAILMVPSTLIKLPTNFATNAALDGASATTGIPGLSMPGGVGELVNAGQDGWSAINASHDAVDAAAESSPY